MTSLPRRLGDDERAEIHAVVSGLTLDQKCALTAGRDMWSTNAIPEAGIPAWRTTDGPSGARGTMLGPAGVRALCMPSGSALAATWDVDLVREVGAALGRETRARGARILLGPTVNIQRSPLNGRTFECFSEDPCLAGAVSTAYVQGVQAEGVIATVKHYAGNEAEFERNSINSIIDERSLRELYLAPFEAAVKQGGTLGIMTAYNRLNGTFCADHRWLIADVLRDEWGFEGITISDWWALATTDTAAVAGLDLEMPGPARAMGPALAAAIRCGSVQEAAVDAIVTRLLTAMTMIDARADASDSPERPFDMPADVALARRAAAEAMVLVRNQGALLPLVAADLKRIAILGPNAGRAQIMGGGSATLRAQHLTSPLDAFEAATASLGIEIAHAAGCPPTDDFAVLEASELRTPTGEPGLQVSFHAGRSLLSPVLAEHRADRAELTFMGSPADGVPPEGFALRARGQYLPVADGRHRFRLSTNAAAHLTIAGAAPVALAWGDDDAPRRMREAEFEIDARAGSPIDIDLEFAGESALNFCQVTLKCLPPSGDDALVEAEALAAAADVALVVVGTGPAIESEGFDRSSHGLPGRQDELVRRIVAANPRTIVIVNSGSPVAMPWIDTVPAVLQCWFGGQEMAPALTDVVLGSAEPGGRAPISFPHRIEHSPSFGNFPGGAGEVRYGEGLLVGYRWYEARDLPVAVPFGHGLGYTRFSWRARLQRDRIAAGDTLTVIVDVTNVGDRRGADVVQVYVAPPPSPLPRAPKELRGFAKLILDAGETRTVEIALDARAFAYWHPGDEATESIQQRLTATPFAAPDTAVRRRRGWAIEAGDHIIHVARSSADIVQSLTVMVDGALDGIAP